MYSRDLEAEYKKNEIKVAGLQVLEEDGSVIKTVKFQISDASLYYFMEEGKAGKP